MISEKRQHLIWRSCLYQTYRFFISLPSDIQPFPFTLESCRVKRPINNRINRTKFFPSREDIYSFELIFILLLLIIQRYLHNVSHSWSKGCRNVSVRTSILSNKMGCYKNSSSNNLDSASRRYFRNGSLFNLKPTNRYCNIFFCRQSSLFQTVNLIFFPYGHAIYTFY